MLGNPQLNTADVKYIQSLVKKYKVQDALNREIETLHAKAITQISKLKASATTKSELTQLVSFCATRQT
jgi:geranylgeranyl pyrophosphate synthase